MKRFISLLSGLAIVAATSTAQAQIDWATGAPGGTTGGSVQFGAEVLANDAGDNAFNLATGIGAAQVAPTSGEDYTVAAWIKSEEAEPSNTALARNNRWWIGTGNQGLHLGIQDDTNDDIDVVTPSGLASAHWSNDSAGSTSIEVNTWVHVTHVYRAGVQEIYLNGVLNGTTVNGAPNMDGTDLQIGSRNGELGPGWNGCIDDVAIFTSALSATDIATLAGDASQAVTLGAAAYYNFEDDQTGSTALNLVDVTASGLVGFDGVTPALQELSGIGAELPPPPPVATWAAGAPDGTTGGSLLFDGEAEQFASTGIGADQIGGNRSGGSLGTDYTISAWINSASADADGNAENNDWWLGTGNQGLHLGIFDNNQLRHGHWASDNSGNTVVAANTWVHATYVFDADGGTTIQEMEDEFGVVTEVEVVTGQISIYRDGVLETVNNTLAPNVSGTDIILGARNGGGEFWSGQIDDVAIFTNTISDTDVEALFNDASQAVALGAVAYYDFEDDQTGTTAANAVDVALSGLVNTDGMPAPQVIEGIAPIVSPFLLGDVNQDGAVNFLDISPFILLLSSPGTFQVEADTNEDGDVNFLDISPFILILST